MYVIEVDKRTVANIWLTTTQTDEFLKPYVWFTSSLDGAFTGWTRFADKDDIPVVPTVVSAFTNDSGYLTEHQSLEDYYTKEEIDLKNTALSERVEKIAADVPTKTSDLMNDSDYVTGEMMKEVINTIPVNVSQLNNDAGYLTEHQSLEDYYTKSQVDASINAVKKSIPTNTSQLNNDSGYLTEHQSLEDYYTKEQTDSAIDGKLAARTEDDPIFTAWKNSTEITAGKSASTVADSSYGTAIGQYSQAGMHATAVGSAAKATGQYSAAIGNGATASDNDSISIGRGVTSHGDNTFNIRPTKLENIYLGGNTLKSLTDTLYVGMKTAAAKSDTTVELSSDKFLTINRSNNLTLTFADTDWQTNCKEYSCAVVCASTITLTVPEGVKWNGSAPSMLAGKTYLLSFFNGYCAWGVF